MPEDAAARRTVTTVDIIRLADFLDRFESADDPASDAARNAEKQFEAGVVALFAECVKPYYSVVTFIQFRGHIRWRCREYLALQSRKPLAPPP